MAKRSDATTTHLSKEDIDKLSTEDARARIRLLQDSEQRLNNAYDRKDNDLKIARDRIQKLTADYVNNVFRKRKIRMEYAATFWALLAIIINLGFFYFIYEKIIENEVNAYKVINRLLLSLPIILLDYFIIKQYSNTSRLAEFYAHKTAISSSLSGYNALLNKEVYSQEHWEMDGSISKTHQSFIFDALEQLYLERPTTQKKPDIQLALNIGNKVKTKANVESDGSNR